MPHADSSYFEPGLSKAEVYAQVLQQAQGLTEGQRNWVSNLASVSSLLWHAYASLPAPSNAVNWAGFYVRKDKSPSSGVSTASDAKNILLLGPFHGKPACQLIPFGRGVCGTAASKRETVIVSDVLEWEGHIACDADSRSEIVVPIVVDGETLALIDIDCTQPSGFDEIDKKGLEHLAKLLAENCDW
ncbi:GAF domain nucleotide-binding protein [Coccidioides immitis RS]|uniref:GAF domain nucleotide-binding protein n=1 Tax=Coccidioides immitis (strain RS) TaxID=246410 RepID=J3KGF6_COCIM|nr:GAF domain nucleotide-binding protein [Coccidioides immitis RS]EAS34822.3 GAF domain nucleotide-binding protein [Coccidioides immitis RS]